MARLAWECLSRWLASLNFDCNPILHALFHTLIILRYTFTTNSLFFSCFGSPFSPRSLNLNSVLLKDYVHSVFWFLFTQLELHVCLPPGPKFRWFFHSFCFLILIFGFIVCIVLIWLFCSCFQAPQQQKFPQPVNGLYLFTAALYQFCATQTFTDLSHNSQFGIMTTLLTLPFLKFGRPTTPPQLPLLPLDPWRRYPIVPPPPFHTHKPPRLLLFLLSMLLLNESNCYFFRFVFCEIT